MQELDYLTEDEVIKGVAYYLQHKPGAMFNTGIRDEGMPHIPGHNSKLVISENALEATPKIFVQYVLDRMEK